MKYFRGITERATAQARYRDLAKIHHPDAGGNPAVMVDVNREWEEWQVLEKHGVFDRRASGSTEAHKDMPKARKTSPRTRTGVDNSAPRPKKSQPSTSARQGSPIVQRQQQTQAPRQQAPAPIATPPQDPGAALREYLHDSRRLVADVSKAIVDFSALVNSVLDMVSGPEDPDETPRSR
jgi:hypothetical protein